MAPTVIEGPYDNDKKLKHKRRYCRMAGCTNIVKSQGLCQRHGAKPRMCKVDRCSKQAQGNFDGMCKSHFKAFKRSVAPIPIRPPSMEGQIPPPAEGVSVYDVIIPTSIAWKPSMGTAMPLIEHLKQGFEDPNKPPAWHRNEERRARGLWPVHNPATQLESWERELVWIEILLLTGNSEASFRHLARGWGRDKGFHMVLAQFICERHGNVERKKRKRGNQDKDNFDGLYIEDTDGDDTDEMEMNTGGVGADVYDYTLYGDSAYNEALAADLFCFPVVPRSEGNDRLFSFDDCIVTGNAIVSGDGSSDASEQNNEDDQELAVIDTTAV